MTFKALMTADLHLCNNLPFSVPSENGKTNRFDEQLRVLEQIFNLAKKNNVDAIFILGDLFDKSLIDSVTLIYTVEYFVKNNDTPIYILPGNHDSSSIKNGRFLVEAYGSMDCDHIKIIGLKNKLISFDDVNFHSMAFEPINDQLKTLKKVKKNVKKGLNVLLMHNGVIGAKQFNWVCNDGLSIEKVCNKFDKVYSGHFHHTQDFGKCGKYLGSPMCHDFRDVLRYPGVHLMEFDGKKKKIKETFLKLKTNRFHIFYNLQNTDFNDIVSGDYVRFDIRATHVDWVKIKLELKELSKKMSVKNINMDWVHRPIYHHKKRLEIDDNVSNFMNMENAIGEYVSSINLSENKLPENVLIRKGLEVLSEVNKEKH